MRVWDIVDQVDGGVQITEKARTKTPLTGFFASAARVAVAVSFVVASSGPFYAEATTACSSPSGIQVPVSRIVVPEPVSPLRRARTSTADTQFGQSTGKLARSFGRFFQPAADEEQLEDYSF